ncbi:hypothetical protein HF521_013086 [Silurus meridionalis]|uniref:Neuropilin C-terminal domain-containing protein n=1 Tax=Silurus meridionalis TaxID=175797 RepID=A0A8T0AEB5_SILME|nr:hypothetical protein HF521_013086 [Silurus meridionalis]
MSSLGVLLGAVCAGLLLYCTCSYGGLTSRSSTTLENYNFELYDGIKHKILELCYIMKLLGSQSWTDAQRSRVARLRPSRWCLSVVVAVETEVAGRSVGELLKCNNDYGAHGAKNHKRSLLTECK